MFKKIESLYLYVRDIERSSRFYTDILGLKLLAKGDSSAEFEMAGDRLGIRQPPPSIPQGWEGPLIFLAVKDLERVVKRLRESGVKTSEEIAIINDYNGSTMKVATFYDPDGNPLHIVEKSPQ